MRWRPRNMWALQSLESRVLLATASRPENVSIAAPNVWQTCHFRDSDCTHAYQFPPQRLQRTVISIVGSKTRYEVLHTSLQRHVDHELGEQRVLDRCVISSVTSFLIPF